MEFHPEKYVQMWLAKGRHSANDRYLQIKIRLASCKREKKNYKQYEALWKLLKI